MTTTTTVTRQPRKRRTSQGFFRQAGPLRPSPFQSLLSYVLLLVWTAIVVFPFYWLLVTAFKLPIDVSSGPKYMPWLDYQPSLHAFDELLFSRTAGNFVTRPYTNTIVVGLVSSALALVVGSAAAYALSRLTFRPRLGLVVSFLLGVVAAVLLAINGIAWRWALLLGAGVFVLLARAVGQRVGPRLGNNDISFWLISQRILPPVVVIIPVYIIYQQLGLLNTHTALIITYATVNMPIVIWFMQDYFASIPLELEESAFIDGATRYGVLWRIVLPLSLPGLVATFLIVLVFAWNEYLLALFLSGANTQTMPLLVASQNATRGPQWWNISVLVLLMVGPLVLLSLLLERYIARGILVGAVKG